MSQYRKKPVVIEAVQWDGPDTVMPDAMKEQIVVNHLFGHCYVQTLEGTMQCCPGDWLILGVKGEVYPCKDEVFRITYESVED